ncbi:MAG: hypothetical protein FJX72_07785, partial [Armatimonadetes bacterium]|nr:hypothetical protein [Armatimonadota bacterium]
MLFFALLATSVTASPRASLRAAYLRCEYLADPVGVNAVHPRLSWELTHADPRMRGAKQTAYRVRCASSPSLLVTGKADLWDSGKAKSEATSHIAYGGKPVAPGSQAFWQVKVWDQADTESEWSAPAHWTRGIPSEQWRADWIGDPTTYLPSQPARNGYHTALAG